MGTKPGGFVREATGLVREFSHVDLFVQAISIMQIGIGVVFLLESVGAFFPGANLFWVVVIAGVVGIAFAALWSIMSAAMPRSGGDYVWISRIIPRAPSIGFMYALTYGLGFAIAFNMGFQVWLFTNGILSPTFASLGLVYGNAALVNLGTWMVSGNGLFITGLFLVLLAVLTVSLGARRGSRIINWLFFFSLIVTFIWIILTFTSSNAQFASAYDSQFGAGAYSNVLQLGATAGFSGYTFSLGSTILVGFSLGYFSLYSNFQYPVWISGEIKNARRIWVPFTLAIVVTGVLYFALIGGLFNLMGGNWLGSIGAASGAGTLPFSVPPTFPFLLTVMFKSNPILVFLINAGLIAGTFTWFVVPYIAFSRLIFSMSFDRVLPKIFANVNQRVHVPIAALLLTVVLVIIWFSQYVYGLFWNPSLISFSTVFFSVTAAAPAAWTVAALVFALFPFINKGLYDKVFPANFKRSIGLPIVTWLGLIVAATQALATYEYVTTSATPVWTAGAALVLMLGSLAVYYVIAALRRRQGVDLKFVFGEIPPE